MLKPKLLIIKWSMFYVDAIIIIVEVIYLQACKTW